MKAFVIYLAGVLISTSMCPTLARATDTVALFECSVLAEWAGLDDDAYRLAGLGYADAVADARDSIAEMKDSAAGKANFLAERTPDFWAGNWYFGATAKVQEWLQKQQPVQPSPDAGAQELETAQGRKAELWKPIALKEYEQRGCEQEPKG